MNVSTKPERDSDRSNLVGLLRRRPTLGIVVVDAKKQIRSLSADAARLLGMDSALAVNGPLEALPGSLRRILRGVLASGDLIEDRPITVPGPEGRETKLAVYATPLGGQANSGAVIVLQELEDENFEQKIRQLDRLASIGTLSATTAHEIKNALVAIKTFVDLLLEKNQDAELAEIVRREMRRISSMVSQTLRFAGPARPAFSPIGLHDLLDHSLRIVQPQFDKKLITFNRAFAASPDVIHGDEYQLEQVFVNLFLNAVEAMGASGTLAVATDTLATAPDGLDLPRGGGPVLRLTISDTGIGISEKNMARLFEPFFTTKENGTGLGLAITQRIIEEHHGVITAQSEPNRGTTITILLPAHVVAD
jgi:signal transduction histidine kinase